MKLIENVTIFMEIVSVCRSYGSLFRMNNEFWRMTDFNETESNASMATGKNWKIYVGDTIGWFYLEIF